MTTQNKSAWFSLDGITSDTYNIRYRADTRQVFPGVRSKLITIGSKNGAYNFGKNTSNTIKHKITIMYLGSNPNDLQQQFRQIKAWLYSTDWKKLIFGDEPDKFYYAQVIEGIDMESLLAIGECDILFECQPFAYMVVDTGDDLTWEEADFPWITEIPWIMSDNYTYSVTGVANCVFDNPGTKSTNNKSPQGSKFDIVITGSFTALTLALNGKTLNYIEAVSNGVLKINNVIQEVELDGTNKINKVTGDRKTFLEAIPGYNTLAVSGTDLNISILIDLTPEWV